MKTAAIALLGALAAASSAQTTLTTNSAFALATPVDAKAVITNQLGAQPGLGAPVTGLSLIDQILTGGAGVSATSIFSGVASGGDFVKRCVIGGFVNAPAASLSPNLSNFSVQVSNSTYSSTFGLSNLAGKSIFSQGAISGDTVNISQLVDGATGDELNGQFGITASPSVYLSRELMPGWTNLDGVAGDGTLLSFYLIPNSFTRSLAGFGTGSTAFSTPVPFRDEILLSGVLKVASTTISSFTTDVSFGAGSTTTIIPVGPSHTVVLQDITAQGIGNKVTLTYTVTGTYNAYDYSGKMIYTGTFFSQSLTQQVVVTAHR